MSTLLEAIRDHARRTPGQVAVDPVTTPPLTYAALAARVDALAPQLAQEFAGGAAALEIDHGADEVMLELALLEAGIPVLSLPAFFTSEQRRHALHSSGVAAILSGVGADRRTACPLRPVPLPAGSARITFTSGSTGAPKGVCLSAGHLEQVAASVVEAVGVEHAGRHLALLPPGILLETVAGLFATLMAGGTYVCPPQSLCGLGDPFRPDFVALAARIAEWNITSLILVPELLAGLVSALEASGGLLLCLSLVAVGGARVPLPLLERARGLGLPVRQGYGLTECGSVVSLEDAAGDAIGSAGRPLSHMAVRLADDGEILLDGPLCLGEIGGAPPVSPFATGDIGRIDADGRLWITGRKSNLIVTAHGRNVSPEWVEEALLAQQDIAQAFVHGDGMPFPCALLVPASTNADLSAAVDAANATLPAYARVATWRQVAHFTPQNSRLTGNGRLRRAEILRSCIGAPDRFTQLEDETVRERLAFLAVPQVRAGLAGSISRVVYIAYLTQAYHHVKHTVPLMQAARDGLMDRPELVEALDEYIAEETGHEEWILADIAAAGGDANAARASTPHPATKAMVDHAYGRIAADDPVAFFGMVYVLESVSVALATRGAGAVAERLGLPPQAFTYLTSHGALDQSHMKFFAGLVNGFGEADMASVRRMAREMFALFGGMFAAIDLEPDLEPA
ncbi:AMP-binding protein [Altererythrobacter salegens]|uniref:AMP-binding protein n=1 Tax=Croceibacterium salegens TaxID=1737568 RepID=A0A6I4STK8_9SPHN|nr:AMP-binding protein [Croceibacterium salegens]